jgi:hypothetical protein
LDGVEELRGDGEEVGLEDGEAEAAQDVGEIRVWRGRRDTGEEVQLVASLQKQYSLAALEITKVGGERLTSRSTR